MRQGDVYQPSRTARGSAVSRARLERRDCPKNEAPRLRLESNSLPRTVIHKLQSPDPRNARRATRIGKVKCEVDYDRYRCARVRGAGSFHGHFRRVCAAPKPSLRWDGRCRTAARRGHQSRRMFLSGVAACGVELVQVLAKAQAVPLHASRRIFAHIDRSTPYAQMFPCSTPCA